ncbi:porin [Paraburkholderia humisilvae]|uniref:Outer membrane porin protein n=1 Tax=Paraburkholderia humisilvae TaxID=627669 RepID=A0A6J5CWW8_9BURK|nr:porin [Paraburkholderia humisilvae]CAB3745667.1 Outer membrane porin protein [Paraburkholderia humisilvae]
MKKMTVGLAMAGLFAGHAYAQSSITLYGIIDEGITYTNNQAGHSTWQQTDGAINTSRWGLRGSEDLGDGLKAIFTLENGFNASNGTLRQGGREFGRQAFVGLGSSRYGTLTLGRQYDSVVDYLGPLALTGTQYGGTFFAHPFDNDNLDNDFRVNNSVKYQSPDFRGLHFGALYSFSNAAGDFANNRAYSFGASYAFSGLTFSAAYLQINQNLTSAVISNANGALNGDATFFADRQRTWGAGVKYSFGPFTTDFVFTQTLLDNAFGISAGESGVANGLALNGGSVRFNNYEVNGRYTLGSPWTVAAGYVHTDGSVDAAHPHWDQINIQTAYLLSVRTQVYVQAEYQHVAQDGLALGAIISGLPAASTTPNQVAVTLGLRHTF